MVDLNPEIWENETLGKAAHNERLDRLEKQQHENRAARLEDREPREVVVDNDYPDWTPEVQKRTGTVPSNAGVVHFADENPNDVVQTGPGMQPEGLPDEEWNKGQETVPNENAEVGDEESSPVEYDENEASEVSATETSPEGAPDYDSETAVSNPPEESDSTQWK
jgi:hypothetical protein